MMSKFRESFWESDRSLRNSYLYTVKHKKIPFTDPLRIRPDLLENEGFMQLLWAHLGIYKGTQNYDTEVASSFPEDSPEVQAYKQRKYLESIEGRPLWGLEIGVRYVSITSPPSPSVVDRRISALWHGSNARLRQYPNWKGFLYWVILGMLLSGGPDKFTEAADYTYRHRLHEADEDPALIWYPIADEDNLLLQEYWG